MIFIYLNPDTTIQTAALVAAGTSNILSKTNSLISHDYGDKDQGTCLADQETCLADQQSCRYADRVSPMFHHMRKDQPSQRWTPLTDEYMNKKTGTFNKTGQR